MYDDHSSPLPSYLILPKMDAYFKNFGSSNRNTIFLVNDKKLLKQYYKIWNGIKKLFGKEFNSETVH